MKLPSFGAVDFLRFFVPTLLAAIFSALLLAFRTSRLLESQFSALGKRIASLPDEVPTEKLSQATLRELEELENDVDNLKSRLDTMRHHKKAAIEKGLEQREMKAQFFAGMSHDLRSPLNSVIGFTDLLAKGLEGELTEEQNRTVLHIGEEAEKLMVLITDILDSSKHEAGKLELDHSRVGIVDIVNEAISEARRLIGTRSLSLMSSMEQGLPILWADKIRLRQALVSLIAKTMNVVEGGSIKVATSIDREGNIRIRIHAASTSLSATQREQFRLALDPLAQTTQGRGGKLGLGIGLARDVVRMHGGELLIGNEKTDQALFTVVLPLDDTQHRE